MQSDILEEKQREGDVNETENYYEVTAISPYSEKLVLKYPGCCLNLYKVLLHYNTAHYTAVCNITQSLAVSQLSQWPLTVIPQV